ncbi:hypothetical protein Lal_00020871 [Lupinus albus]|nr:hypothetical protein Lal_00020871 [Lupinus albus]
MVSIDLEKTCDKVHREVPKCMLFVDDGVLVRESRDKLNMNLEMWRQSLEALDFPIRRNRTRWFEHGPEETFRNPSKESQANEAMCAAIHRDLVWNGQKPATLSYRSAIKMVKYDTCHDFSGRSLEEITYFLITLH